MDELKAGIPAIVALAPVIALIRFLCGYLGLRRLRLALTLVALAVSLAVFSRMAPTIAQPFAAHVWVITNFAAIYFVFKLAEVLLLDVAWRRRNQPQPPVIFRDLMSTVFACVVLVILVQVGLNVHVATLVITSAALSIFLGLALQQTVSDLFAGVALVMERPFVHGDWVKIGERVGRVEEISWRAVRIRLLRFDDYLIVPNSVIAKADIVNMSSPTRVHGSTIEVGVAYGHAPNRVREVMRTCALEVPGVLTRPEPLAEVVRFEASSIVYRVTYWIDDLPRSLDIEAAVRSQLWYAFQRTGIEIPFPILRAYTEPLAEVRAAADDARCARVAALLGRVDFMSALDPQQVAALAKNAPIALYPAGALVVKRGDAGTSLFVVASGRAEVLSEPPGGGALLAVGAREVGDYFGEMSLLADVPRPVDVRVSEDTELVVLTREVMRAILVADPAVADRLSQTLSRHLAGSQKAMEEFAGHAAAPVAYQAHTLLRNIRRVFGLVGAEP
jgi:small-conductance mechanosensitive channel